MLTRKRMATIALCLVAAALLAFVGGLFGKRTREIGREIEGSAELRCAYDGTAIHPLYQVDAYLHDGSVMRFCSIYCASRWLEKGENKVVYFTVTDEATGQKIDSTLGHFVESDLVTVKAVNNRIHAFFTEQDALTHTRQFNGRLLENPFGRGLVLPKIARLDTLSIGAPAWPDVLPLKLAIFKPIFKENRLDVRLVPIEGAESGSRLLADGSVQGVLCDLPSALLLARAQPSVRIIKNVLRANPYRPLFAIVSGPKGNIRNLEGLAGAPIAVPKGISFRFYLEYYLKQESIPVETAVIRETEDVAAAWDMLIKGEVGAALLRTPYTDMAIKNQMTLLADDRNLPWMSVLVVKQSIVEDQAEILERFVFGLEQSVLALNLKPDEYRGLLMQHGAIPDGARKRFPMPIFEGANAPAKEEIEPIVKWLTEKGFFSQTPAYDDLVNTRFLPDPNNVGLAFCCR